MAGDAAARPSRAPKTIERFAPATGPVKEKSGVVVHEGDGQRLGDIERIADGLKSLSSDHDLCKALHALLFGGFGTKTTRKKDIRAFNGFPKEGASAESRTEKLLEKKTVWTTAALKDLATLFGLEKSGDREALCKRVVDFLESPSEENVKGGSIKRKRSSGEKVSKKGKKGKKQKGDKPKRALTAFILFSNDKRGEIRKKDPSLSVPEVGKLLGEAWRDASDATKKKYKDLAEKGKAKLEKEKGKAKATEEDDDDVIEDEEEAEEGEKGEEEEEDEAEEEQEEEAPAAKKKKSKK